MQSVHSIWQVVDSRFYGGIESHILYLASALKESNMDVRVVFLRDYGAHPLKEKLDQAGIIHFCCSGVESFLNLSAIKKPDLIHSHGYKANLVCRLARIRYNIPVVTSFHAGDSESWRLKLYTLLDRKTAFLASSVAVNAQSASSVSGSIRVIDNFVPLPRLFCPPMSLKRIGFVGRLSHEKGPDRFLALAREFPRFDFNLYGDGPLATELQEAAPSNVSFMGHQQSMQSAWRSMDLLCMPSRKEGLPLAALEAMSHGIPVLCLDAGALPKLVINELNGWVVFGQHDEQQVVRKLAGKLDQIQSANLAFFGQKARATIEKKFSPQALLPDFLSLYQQTVSAHPLEETA